MKLLLLMTGNNIFPSITLGQVTASNRNLIFFFHVKEKFFSNMIYTMLCYKFVLHMPNFLMIVSLMSI
jgi:hypothetical protein